MELSRRKFVLGAIAAPFIVRTAGLLMPVHAIEEPSFEFLLEQLLAGMEVAIEQRLHLFVSELMVDAARQFYGPVVTVHVQQLIPTGD